MVYVMAKCDTCGDKFMVMESDLGNHQCYCGDIHCKKCLEIKLHKGTTGIYECKKCTDVMVEEYLEYMDIQ